MTTQWERKVDSYLKKMKKFLLRFENEDQFNFFTDNIVGYWRLRLHDAPQEWRGTYTFLGEYYDTYGFSNLFDTLDEVYDRLFQMLERFEDYSQNGEDKKG